MGEPYERKLIAFPGADISPEVVLHRTLDKLDHIKAVTVIIQWDDDTMAVDWSTQKTSMLCMGSVVLSDVARRAAMNEDDGA